MNTTFSTQKENVLNVVNYLSLSVMTVKTIKCINVQNVEYGVSVNGSSSSHNTSRHS
jgi:hypothetical protein